MHYKLGISKPITKANSLLGKTDELDKLKYCINTDTAQLWEDVLEENVFCCNKKMQQFLHFKDTYLMYHQTMNTI